MTARLIVVDSRWRSGAPVPPQDGGSAFILSFSQSADLVEQVRRELEARGVSVNVESGAPALDEVVPYVTGRYLDLLATAPSSVREGWTFECLSLWWLNEVSGRRSDIYPTFTRLCQLEVMRRAIRRTGVVEVALLSSDGAFAATVGSLCSSLGVRYLAASSARDGSGLSVMGIAARLGLWMVRTISMTALAKLLTLATRPAPEAPVCVFHTIYPMSFLGTGGKTDEKYLRIPALLAERGVTPFIGVTFAADDGHQHISLRRYIQACLSLRKTAAYDGVGAGLIDRDLSWRTMVRGFASGIAASLRQVRAERSPSFRRRWTIDGVGVFPVLRAEMRMAAYRTPRYLMHMLRMRAFLNRLRPDAVVSTLFEFCYGRATSYAIASSDAKPLNIGAQHGPTGRKLMYRFAPGELGHGLPMPDHLLLEGEEARTTFESSGYPVDRLHTLGAPRFDALATVAHWRHREGLGPRRVLVAFGASDGLQIMSLCRPVIASTPGYHFIMKPHPRSSVQSQNIERALAGAMASTFEIATGNLYDVLPSVDVVIATYSSVGQEAAALGYPTIVLHLPDFASPSGLLDVSGSVQFAASPEDLKAALAWIAQADRQGVEAIERTFFWKIDGQAQQRWADKIVDLMGERRPPR